jgi:hypothetical protein
MVEVHMTLDEAQAIALTQRTTLRCIASSVDHDYMRT